MTQLKVTPRGQSFPDVVVTPLTNPLKWTNQYGYSGKRLSEIQTKLCLAWFIARDTVPHTTAHRYM
jgi:hypothetical protein